MTDSYFPALKRSYYPALYPAPRNPNEAKAFVQAVVSAEVGYDDTFTRQQANIAFALFSIREQFKRMLKSDPVDFTDE